MPLRARAALAFVVGLAVESAFEGPPRPLRILLLQQRGEGDGRAEFMFQPVMGTLVAMLGVYAAERAGVLFEHAAVLPNEAAQRFVSLESGDLFIWLGWLGATDVPWAALAGRGVRTVYYRTEPMEAACSPSAWKLSETWHYTRALGTCELAHGPISRYLPPGALSTSLHVNTLPNSTALTFIGHPHFNIPIRGPTFHHRRDRCFQALEREMHGQLQAVNNVWSEASFAALMRMHSIYLSFHKACLMPDQPLEAFRVSKLLEYGRLVIAERSFAGDEREFDGLVTFGTLADVPKLHQELLQMPLAERAALAEARAAAFRVRFSPQRLFNESGLHALLERMRTESPDDARRLPFKSDMGVPPHGAAPPAANLVPAWSVGQVPAFRPPGGPVSVSALEKCLDRLKPSSVARSLATRALTTAQSEWSQIVAWHRSTEDPVASVVHGRVQTARCAVVGNSPLLLSAPMGAEIDAHDVVLRFNFAPTVGYEKFVGTRTHLRMMAQVYVPANRSEGSVVLHRYYAPFLAGEDKAANGNYSVAQLTGWPLIRIGTSRRRRWFPSSGIAGALLLMRSCAGVSMYGFDLNGNSPGHYFDEEIEGLLPNMRTLLREEPWRLELAPHSLYAPKINQKQQRRGADGRMVPPTLELKAPGAYNALVRSKYVAMNASAGNHNLQLERAALYSFIKAGCLVQHVPSS